MAESCLLIGFEPPPYSHHFLSVFFWSRYNTTADMPRPPPLDTAARGYCLCEETAFLVKTSFSADLWSPVLRFSGLVFEQIDK